MSPLPLGILALSGAGAAGAFELLESQILGSNQSSVIFSNLNTNYGADYRHLQLRMTVRTDRTGADSDPIRLRFNSDTGANYSRNALRSNFGSLSGAGSTGNDALFLTENAAVAQNATYIFTPIIADVLLPFDTTRKTVRALSGLLASGWYGTEEWAGYWNNTNAITTMEVSPLVGTNFVIGSRFSLYGWRSN